MAMNIPGWALRPVTPADREPIKEAHDHSRVQIEWPDRKALREWARMQGWPTPWFGFEDAFINKMVESDENFDLALRESGIAMRLPKEHYTISSAELQELDALYEARGADGRPTSWGSLVEELREIRRAVEAGVVVTVAGREKKLRSWQGFYDWAHGRYHMLEDGYDSWIGDDDS